MNKPWGREHKPHGKKGIRAGTADMEKGSLLRAALWFTI